MSKITKSIARDTVNMSFVTPCIIVWDHITGLITNQ